MRLNNYFAVLGVLLSTSVFSQQMISLADNGMAFVKVSPDGINRIAVEGDRIKLVYGLEGLYTLSQDTEAGQIFIKPSFVGKQPIHLFLTTEHHKNYQLALLPTAHTAETIVLHPLNTEDDKLFLRSDFNEEEAVVQFIEGMIQGDEKEEFHSHTPSHIQPITLSPQLEITLLHTYKTPRWRGEEYMLKNTGREVLSLKAQQFYRPSVLAIALREETLSPQHTTLLYRVRHNELRRK